MKYKIKHKICDQVTWQVFNKVRSHVEYQAAFKQICVMQQVKDKVGQVYDQVW